MSVEELRFGPSPIEGVPTSITAFVGQADTGPVDEPVRVASVADFERTFGEGERRATLGTAVRHFFANGGSQALVVRVADPTGADPAAGLLGDAAARTGLHALRKADLFNLLCIPPLRTGAEPNDETPATVDVPIPVWAAASVLCRDRRALLIVDAPREWTVQSSATGVAAFAGLERSNAALYFPWLRVADAQGDALGPDVAPSGAVAGVISRIDATRGVWRAPAGMDAALRGVQGLSVNGQLATINQRDGEALNTLGVNCLRAFPAGVVIWGARTLAGDDALASEWKYVNVRRLALYIEESIDRGTQWVVFEPNDEPLWARLRSDVGAFMETLFRNGAFQGATPRDAYFVKCDRTTMTQNDIDNGRVIVLVGFAPLRPAEFVILRIELAAAA